MKTRTVYWPPIFWNFYSHLILPLFSFALFFSPLPSFPSFYFLLAKHIFILDDIEIMYSTWYMILNFFLFKPPKWAPSTPSSTYPRLFFALQKILFACKKICAWERVMQITRLFFSFSSSLLNSEFHEFFTLELYSIIEIPRAQIVFFFFNV